MGLSPDTIRSYAFTLLSFFRWLKEDWSKFKKFNQKNLQSWMFHLNEIEKLKPRSINMRLCCIRAFYRFSFDAEIPHAAGVLYPKAHYRGPRRYFMGLKSKPRQRFTQLKIKVPRKVVDPLKPQDVDQFLQDINRYRDLSLILTMLLCGIRSQEAISLKLSDVDFHQSQLRVQGKGRRERILPMPIRLMQVFDKYLQLERPTDKSQYFFVVLQGKRTGEQMTRAGLRRLFRYRREKLSIPKAKPHQFRHAFASDMARAGMPLTTIQKMMGHSDPKTTLIYIELFLDDIRADYENALKRIEERYATLHNKQITG